MADGTPDVPELVSVPADLALVSDDELNELLERATAEFDTIETQPVSGPNVARASELSGHIDRIKNEQRMRVERAAADRERSEAQMAEQMAALRAHVRGEGSDGAAGEGGTAAAAAAAATVDPEAIAAAAARGAATAILAMQDRGGAHSTEVAKRITTSLAAAASYAPPAKAPARNQLVVTASVDIPGVGAGETLPTIERVTEAFQRRAKSLPVARSRNEYEAIEAGHRVATIRNEYEHTVDDRMSAKTIQELHEFLTSPDKQEALVAGGGWCAPSEIRYEFFNIADSDGAVDLPTVGVSRGGINHVVSPSLADAQLAPFVSAFSNQSNPWLWTETDDQATVTGTPNKPCIRVPCPTFTDRRLECYGVCLTAGNLTDDAYPEGTTNFIRLLMAAHRHAMNARIIATMAALSTAPTTLAGGTDNAFNCIIGGISLGAVDYRARYGMARDAVLEVVIPAWVLDALTSDLAWHTGDNTTLSVTEGTIRGYLADRNIRPQFVNDYQVRASGLPGFSSAMTVWPTTVTVMMYAAGTFLKGNGLTLDLGVVRDSALNAENDFTAAWSEECHLVARLGHESRQYTITFNVGGLQQAPVASAPGF